MPEQNHHLRAQSPEYALLGFLYGQSNHGYNLHQQLANELGHIWHVSQSQTYAILKRLETQGAVSSTTLEQGKLPPRQILQITATGRRRFEAWLQTPSGSSVRAIRLEFITRLYFARKISPEKIQLMLTAQTSEIKKMLVWLEASLAEIPEDQLFNRLSQQLRIRQLRSIVDWLEECRQAF